MEANLFEVTGLFFYATFKSKCVISKKKTIDPIKIIKSPNFQKKDWFSQYYVINDN